jgi:hypothetical protein
MLSVTYQVHRQKVRFQLFLELLHRGVPQVLLVRMAGVEAEVDGVHRRSHQTEGWGDAAAGEAVRANADRNGDEDLQVLRRKRNRPRISDRNKG